VKLRTLLALEPLFRVPDTQTIQHGLRELAMISTLLFIPFDAIFLSGGPSLIVSSSLCSAFGKGMHV
jgi:hypothetical protein